MDKEKTVKRRSQGVGYDCNIHPGRNSFGLKMRFRQTMGSFSMSPGMGFNT